MVKSWAYSCCFFFSSWLKEWKLRTDREERKKQKEKKQEEDGNGEGLYFFLFLHLLLASSVFILTLYDASFVSRLRLGLQRRGLPGRSRHVQYNADHRTHWSWEDCCCLCLCPGARLQGASTSHLIQFHSNAFFCFRWITSLCAHTHILLKVFEVNASSQRSGRLILSQLKEATQSHQVDNQGVNAHKPTYFNSYATSAVRSGSSPSMYRTVLWWHCVWWFPRNVHDCATR